MVQVQHLKDGVALVHHRQQQCHLLPACMVAMAKGLAIYFQEVVKRKMMAADAAKALMPDVEQWDNNAVLEALVGKSTHQARISQHENKPLVGVNQLLSVMLVQNKPVNVELIDWRNVASGSFQRKEVAVSSFNGDQKQMMDTWWSETTRLYSLENIAPWRLGAILVDPRGLIFGALAHKVRSGSGFVVKPAVLSVEDVERGEAYLQRRFIAHKRAQHHRKVEAAKAKMAMEKEEEDAAKAKEDAAKAKEAEAKKASSSVTAAGFTAAELGGDASGSAGGSEASGSASDGVKTIAELMYGSDDESEAAAGAEWTARDEEQASSEAKASWIDFRKLQLKLDYEKYTDEDVLKRMKRIETGRGAGRPDFATLDDTLAVHVDRWMHDIAISPTTEPDVVIWARIGISLITGCMSSAHVERVNSVAKWILNDKRNLLADEELEALCILRMNRDFIGQCKSWFPEVFA